MFGVDKLPADEESSVQDVDLGQEEEEEATGSEADGQSHSKEPSTEDKQSFARLQKQQWALDLDRQVKEEKRRKEEEAEDDEEEDDEEEEQDIQYLLGDVIDPHATDPQATDPPTQEDAIVVHCVDGSGRWGRGGLFTALEARSEEPRKQYELAASMEELVLGKLLLFPINEKQFSPDRYQLALIVAQQRDGAMQLTALKKGLREIYSYATKRTKASVHLPRSGHSSSEWYGIERLIRKHLASRGVATFIYYPNGSVKMASTALPTASTSATMPASPDQQPDRVGEEEQNIYNI